MICPFCGSDDLREKMGGFACNKCGKNFPRAFSLGDVREHEKLAERR